MRTPFSWLAARYSTGPRMLQAAATSALVAAILIVAGGGVVRVTGSGLGCPEWPNCTSSTLAPTAEMGIHGIIEFGNRLITVLLCVIIAWLIITARLQKNQRRDITRTAWWQFWVVVLNAVMGGVTVWVDLNPFMVAAHFIAAMLLATSAAITFDKVNRMNKPATEPGSPAQAKLGTAVLVLTAIIIVIGTLVTGSGPHAGDSADVPRMPFNWTGITVLHGVLTIAPLVLVLILWASARKQGKNDLWFKSVAYLGTYALQAAIGIVQSFTGLPEWLVVLHLCGAAFLWIGAVRLFITSRTSLKEPAASPELSRTA